MRRKKSESKSKKVPKLAKWVKAKPNERLADIARSSLKTRLRAVKSYLVLAAKRFEDDPEYVHQLRVCCSRGQAAVELYGELIPQRRAARLTKQLKQIRQATNDARDLDVFAARLAADVDNPAAERLLMMVREMRRDAQEDLLAVYRHLRHGRRFKRQSANLLFHVRRRGKRKRWKSKRFGKWGRARLRQVVDAFFVAAEGDLSDIAALHDLRIHGKSLRYAMELLGDAASKELRRELYPAVAEIQQLLGNINDHAVAQQRLGTWSGQTDDPMAGEYLAQIISTEQQQLAQAQEEFTNWWTPERKQPPAGQIGFQRDPR